MYERRILKSLNLVRRKEDGQSEALRQVVNVRPPEGVFLPFLRQQLQPQLQGPQLLCCTFTFLQLNPIHGTRFGHWKQLRIDLMLLLHVNA